MPNYDYECASCGSFTLFRPIAESDDSQACLECGTESHRVILTAPSLGGRAAKRNAASASNKFRLGREIAKRSKHVNCSCCRLR
jgi:putative FmdB family regulatory protein